MQVPTADPEAKNDLQVKCDKLEERLKVVELKSQKQTGELQVIKRDNGNLKTTYNELKDAHQGLKEAHEGLKAANGVCGV
jgi:hypothetical protein